MIISLLLIIKVIIKPQVNHFSNIVKREKQERKQFVVKIVIKTQVYHCAIRPFWRIPLLNNFLVQRKQLLGIKPMRSGYMTISALVPSYNYKSHAN